MAKKHKIVRIQDGAWQGLVYDDKGRYSAGYTLPLGKPTSQEYADLCDKAAENSNDHAFCGVHEALLSIISRFTHSDTANLIMKSIAEAGGLHRLTKETP